MRGPLTKAYVLDGMARKEEEETLRAADAKRADETGRIEQQRASSVAAQPLGPLTPNSDFNARLNGLDPQVRARRLGLGLGFGLGLIRSTHASTGLARRRLSPSLMP